MHNSSLFLVGASNRTVYFYFISIIELIYPWLKKNEQDDVYPLTLGFRYWKVQWLEMGTSRKLHDPPDDSVLQELPDAEDKACSKTRYGKTLDGKLEIWIQPCDLSKKI